MADTRITDLTSASASTGDELVVSTTAATDRKVTAVSIANLAHNLNNTTISALSLAPQTSTLTPLKFTAPTTAGELNATATVGGLEYDGKAFYASVQTSARGIIMTEQIITQTSAYTGTTAGTAQKMFDASTGLNGAVTVGPSVTYMFDTQFTITGRSTLTHTIAYGFGGTAAIDRITFNALSAHNQATSTPAAPVMVRCTVNNHAINATNTSSNCVVFITGKLTVGTSGTIIPQITRSASVVALTVAPDSWFRIWPIGSTAVNRVGHWS